MLISCGVTSQLTFAFVFTYAKDRFSHNVTHCLSEPQPILFEVRCDDHNVQIGGYPWHYIITPHGTMGFFSVHNLKDHKLVRGMKPFFLETHIIVFSSPVQSTGRAIVVTLSSAFALALAFPSRHF